MTTLAPAPRTNKARPCLCANPTEHHHRQELTLAVIRLYQAIVLDLPQESYRYAKDAAHHARWLGVVEGLRFKE